LLTKTLKLKHFTFSSLYKAFLFFFIVFFLYLNIIDQVSVSLQTHDIKILSSYLNLTYTKGLAVWLLKSVQNECRNLYNRWSEDCCWEDFFLSSNIYDKTTQHKESYRREHAEHEDLYRSSLHLCDELRQFYISYISRYSYFNISCYNITFFSRISQLYKQSHLKAAHCSNESELTLKVMSFWPTYIQRKKSEIQTLTTTNCC